jgi:hypothetical protein
VDFRRNEGFPLLIQNEFQRECDILYDAPVRLAALLFQTAALLLQNEGDRVGEGDPGNPDADGGAEAFLPGGIIAALFIECFLARKAGMSREIGRQGNLPACFPALRLLLLGYGRKGQAQAERQPGQRRNHA